MCPTAQPLSPSHPARAVSAVLVALLGSFCVVSVLAIGVGGLFVLADARSHDDKFDGLGAGLGWALAILGGVALAAGGSLLATVVGGRRHAARTGDLAGLSRAGLATAVSGLLACLACLALRATAGDLWPLLLPAALVSGLGVALHQSARPPR